MPEENENHVKHEWTIPERGDALKFESAEPAVRSIRGRIRGVCFDVSALPAYLTISKPDFVTPPLSPEQVETAASLKTHVTPPKLWGKLAKDSNALRVKINDHFPFEVPFEVDGEVGEGEVVARLKTAIRAALQRAVEHISFLEKKHESERGITAEPGPYRLAFNLARVDNDEAAPRFTGKPEDTKFKIGE